ncbi:41398_t:CDS:1, partial [Gigaspora margarita]
MTEIENLKEAPNETMIPHKVQIGNVNLDNIEQQNKQIETKDISKPITNKYTENQKMNILTEERFTP